MKRARAILLIATALVPGCSSPPPPARDPIDAIAARALKGEAISDGDFAILCEKGDRRHVDALFFLVEREKPERAFAVISSLALLLAAEDLPRLDTLLAAADPSRTLLLLRQARLGAAHPMIAKRSPELLKGKAAKVALGTMGALRVRDATQAILDYLDRDDADFRAAMRALGRIWEQKLEAAALQQKDEHRRLTVLALAHGLGMRADDKDAIEAMLRVMTSKELDEFLAKHAKDKFSARAVVAEVCGEQAFDAKKGALVHRALLSSPDGDLVALILWSSPHTLAPVRLLDDTRGAKVRGVPEVRLCDYAAARLEAEAAKSNPEIDASKDAREKLLKKWQGKQPQ